MRRLHTYYFDDGEPPPADPDLQEVGEAEVRMVEDMYKETTAVVRIEEETSEQFGVGVGLRCYNIIVIL